MKKMGGGENLKTSLNLYQKAEAILENRSPKATIHRTEAEIIKHLHEMEVYEIELELTTGELTYQIEEKAKLTAELIIANEKLLNQNLIVEGLRIEMAVLDDTGSIIVVNQLWRESANTNATDPDSVCEGANYLTVCDKVLGEDEMTAKTVAAGIRSVIQNNQIIFTIDYLCDTINEKKWLNVIVSSFLSNGDIRILVVHQNCTAKKMRELEMSQYNLQLQKIIAEKDKFFSIIAHDLRGPFSGFLGLTELLSERSQDMEKDTTQQIALLMNHSAMNLFQLLENLLEWSKMQRGLVVFNPQPHSLLDKINESIPLASAAAEKKAIRIDYEVAKELAVFADGYMLGGIFRNLVANAVKFTPAGGVITISALVIPDNWIEISVKDSGIGMNQHMIDNLFSFDVNTNRKGTDGEESSGLGLMLCKDFIIQHGGKLTITSENGKGSAFRFTLPTKLNDLSVN